jgi:hypothetical protein
MSIVIAYRANPPGYGMGGRLPSGVCGMTTAHGEFGSRKDVASSFLHSSMILP